MTSQHERSECSIKADVAIATVFLLKTFWYPRKQRAWDKRNKQTLSNRVLFLLKYTHTHTYSTIIMSIYLIEHLVSIWLLIIIINLLDDYRK